MASHGPDAGRISHRVLSTQERDGDVRREPHRARQRRPTKAEQAGDPGRSRGRSSLWRAGVHSRGRDHKRPADQDDAPLQGKQGTSAGRDGRGRQGHRRAQRHHGLPGGAGQVRDGGQRRVLMAQNAEQGARPVPAPCGAHCAVAPEGDQRGSHHPPGAAPRGGVCEDPACAARQPALHPRGGPRAAAHLHPGSPALGVGNLERSIT
mmetsp:Transcript_34185/g.80993  ORF Transcript_34185/g.80993 Transcript_34185/m.80993 type:complete len:207 (+) Transcript_34185:1659-2279(+)